MVGFIYKYENRINHKVYIGQTTDLVSRKASHRYSATFVKTKFYNAVRKYGWDNFDFDVVAQVEENSLETLADTLDKLEVDFIQKYDSFNNGYNSTAGGKCYRGKVISEEFREYCRNRRNSPETRQKISNANRGRTFSKETKQKFREAAIRRDFGRIYRDRYEEKRTAAIKKALSIPVLQLDEDNNILNEFQSISEAALYMIDKYKVSRNKRSVMNAIHKCVYNNDKLYKYRGFIWLLKTAI